MKAPKENEVASPMQVCLTKRENYTNVNENENDKDNVVPDLVLPPSPPSKIFTPSEGTKDQILSGENHRGHTRDDSLETTISQSMDLSSFIKSLELQQEEKRKQQLGHDHKRKTSEWSFSGCDNSHDDSLSLAASQADISLANDTENIQVESNSSESESKINSKCNGSNDDKKTTNEPKQNNDPKLVVLKEPKDPLAVHYFGSPALSQSASVTNDSYDPDTMIHFGEQLFRESLKVGEEKCNQKKTQTNIDSDLLEKNLSKGDKEARSVSKMIKFLIFAIILTVFVFGSEVNVRPGDAIETIALLTACDLANQECQEPLTSDALVEDISRSKKSDFDRVSHDFSNPFNRLFEEQKNHKDDGLPNSTEPNASIPDDPIQYGSSNRLCEDQTMEENTEMPTPSNENDYGPYNGTRFAFLNSIILLCFVSWPVAILFVVYRLFSSLVASSSPFEKKVEMKSNMKAKTPVAPTGTSLCRKRDGFLTPPLSSKNRAQEPTEWMSPCYGDDAIDISVYRLMKHAEIRMLLCNRKCDTRGNKEKLIKTLIMSYQNELACLTVHQLRPKLRKRKLSQQGTKKDIIRRLVETGPIIATKG